jgi:hypothetical protein
VLPSFLQSELLAIYFCFKLPASGAGLGKISVSAAYAVLLSAKRKTKREARKRAGSSKRREIIVIG